MSRYYRYAVTMFWMMCVLTSALLNFAFSINPVAMTDLLIKVTGMI